MRKAGLLLLALMLPAHARANPPRLAVVVVVDGLSADLLLGMRPRLTGGLKELVDGGAYVPVAHYEHVPTVTAAGHATIATGAHPWRHGVIGNQLYDRARRKTERVFHDASHPVLGAPLGPLDSAPERLMAETLADRLRMATGGAAHAVSLSLKARAAIPLAGRLGQAYWFSEAVGRFVTGTYYAKELPEWLKAFDGRRHAEAAHGSSWTLVRAASAYAGEDDRPFEEDVLGMGRVFPHPLTGGAQAPGPGSYPALASSGLTSELLTELAIAALEGEALGRDGVPDLLAISYSAIDIVSHAFGPDSFEAQDAMYRLDQALARLLRACERVAGKKGVVVALTADHGMAPVPQALASAGLRGGRLSPSALLEALRTAMRDRFGTDVVASIDRTSVYLDLDAIAARKLDRAAVGREVTRWLSARPEIAIAVSTDDFQARDRDTALLEALRRGYFPGRSGDVLFTARPFVVQGEGDLGTEHGSPYGYDAHVPLILYGAGVAPGVYHQHASVIDLAPTLAALLDIAPPASSEGVVLQDLLLSSTTRRR